MSAQKAGIDNCIFIFIFVSIMPSVADASALSQPQNFSQTFDHASMILLTLTTDILTCLARQSISDSTPTRFDEVRLNYLAAWIPSTATDRLQEPCAYIPYSMGGFSSKAIAPLHVARSDSPPVSDCLVDSISDKFGHKRCCIMYCLLHVISFR